MVRASHHRQIARVAAAEIPRVLRVEVQKLHTNVALGHVTSSVQARINLEEFHGGSRGRYPGVNSQSTFAEASFVSIRLEVHG